MQLNVSTSSGQTKILVPGDSVLVGSATGCDLVVAGAQVAPRHAFLRMDPDGTVALQDLGSPAGTWVGGQRIVESARLAGTEQVQVGDVILSLSLAVSPPTPAAVAPPAPIPQEAVPPSAPPPEGSGPNITLLAAIGVGVVAVVGIVAFLLTGRSSDKETAPPPVVPPAPITAPTLAPTAAPTLEPTTQPTSEPSPITASGAEYEGLVDGSYNGKYGFRMSAHCQTTGPCPVIGKSGAVYHFKYNPSSHTYSAKATDRGTCQGSGPDFPYPVHRAITFRVVHSAEIGGAWQATTLSYTMNSSWPGRSRTVGNTRYFCNAGHSTAKWTGKLVG